MSQAPAQNVAHPYQTCAKKAEKWTQAICDIVCHDRVKGNVGQILDVTDHDPASDIRRVTRYEYGPYGNVIVKDNDVCDLSGDVITADAGYANANPMRFSTKWFDDQLAGSGVNGAVGDTGLGYWGYRYYSPRLGRWLNRDPIGELGALHLCAHVQNNPLNSFDAMGLATYICCRECDWVWHYGGYASPHDFVLAAIAGTWFGDFLNALFLAGYAYIGDLVVSQLYAAGVELGVISAGPFSLAAISAGFISYVATVETGMQNLCIDSYRPTRTVVCEGWIWDTVKYSCPNGGHIWEDDFYDDEDIPTETEITVWE